MIKDYIIQNTELLFETLKELCLIPAPSHFEKKRADYCKALLERLGAKDVYIDRAKNVIFPINCQTSDAITVFAAHTDTVFPDKKPMPYSDDGEIIRSPGVGDDTACVSVLILLAKYFIDNNITPKDGIMFVCNSCEEGLGNLKGVKQLFKDYDGRIKQFISFDCTLNKMYADCVGSHRYEVEVKTEGGHSFSKFGNDNAIHELSKIITAIYGIKVPQKDGATTTYNVGNISGGTSVNTIAQSAKMLCEYRSDDKDCLEYMKNRFYDIFKAAATDKVRVNVTKIGDRPCSDIDKSKTDALVSKVRPIIEDILGKELTLTVASTDCNIPLSLGIPAICMGVFYGEGAHTREEWIKKDSLITGLEAAIKTAVALI